MMDPDDDRGSRQLEESLDLTALAHMLSQTTERLAQELIRPAARAPAWGPLQWRVAMAAAVMHGTSALLESMLAWRGPAVWQAFLAAQRAQMLAREQSIRTLLRQVDDVAREERVGLVGLKGSTMLRLGLYAPGLRPMADVDLLVQPARRDAAIHALGRLGYESAFDGPRDLTLVRRDGFPTPHFGDHPDNPVTIELHSRLFEHLPMREIDITDWVMPATDRSGLNAYPDEAALMRHFLLHAAGNLRTHSLRLVQLHDIARLATRLSVDDWRRLAQAGDGSATWWAYPVLKMVERYVPGAIDGERIERMARGCPALLRRRAAGMTLSGVSLSGLRTPLLPGLAWARSPGEALELAWRRMRPDADARRKMAWVVATQDSVRNHPWMRMSRLRRALRVLQGGAARVQTLYNIDQALAWTPA